MTEPAMAERDFDANPYSSDERRVADWLFARTKGMVGTGDDPIGFVLASYALVHAEKTTAVGPTPEEITEEVEAARKRLYTALGSICVLTGYMPDFPAISGHIRQALSMLPKRRAESHG